MAYQWKQADGFGNEDPSRQYFLLLRDGEPFLSANGHEKVVIDQLIAEISAGEVFLTEIELTSTYGDMVKDGIWRVDSQMTGRLIKIQTKENSRVQRGQTVLTIEAMKMENEIVSPVSGVIVAMPSFTDGQRINEGDFLFLVKEDSPQEIAA